MITVAKIKAAAAIVAIGIGVAGLAGAGGLVVAQMATAPPATQPATQPITDQATVDALTFKLLRAFNELDEQAVMECFLFSEPREENGFYQILQVDLAQLRLEQACRKAFPTPVGARLMGITVSDVMKAAARDEPMPPGEGDVVVRPMPQSAAGIFLTRFPENDPNRAWAQVSFTYRRIDGAWKWDVRDLGQFRFDGNVMVLAETRAKRNKVLIDGYVNCLDTVTDLVSKGQVRAGEVTPLLNSLIQKFKRENGITGADFLPKQQP